MNNNETEKVLSCRYYTSQYYDDCIDEAVTKKMFELFNCSLPFLKFTPNFEECRLDLMNEQQRSVIFNAFNSK